MSTTQSPPRLCERFLLALLMVGLAACTQTTHLRPDALDALQPDSTGPLVLQDKRGVQTRLDPNSELRLLRADGRMTGWHPASALRLGERGVLYLGPELAARAEIARVEVRALDGARSSLVVGGAVLVVGAAIVAAILLADDEMGSGKKDAGKRGGQARSPAARRPVRRSSRPAPRASAPRERRGSTWSVMGSLLWGDPRRGSGWGGYGYRGDGYGYGWYGYGRYGDGRYGDAGWRPADNLLDALIWDLSEPPEPPPPWVSLLEQRTAPQASQAAPPRRIARSAPPPVAPPRQRARAQPLFSERAVRRANVMGLLQLDAGVDERLQAVSGLRIGVELGQAFELTGGLRVHGVPGVETQAPRLSGAIRVGSNFSLGQADTLGLPLGLDLGVGANGLSSVRLALGLRWRFDTLDLALLPFNPEVRRREVSDRSASRSRWGWHAPTTLQLTQRF